MAVVTKSEAEEEEDAICNGDDEKVDVATGRRCCCCCTPTVVEAVAVRPSCTAEGPAKDETEAAERARVLRERMNFIFSH